MLLVRGYVPADTPRSTAALRQLPDGYPAGRISSNTAAAPTASEASSAKKARPSASYSGRASQRARAEQRQQRHRASINIHIISVITLSVRAYFGETAFGQQRAAKGPPPGHCPLRSFSIPQDVAFSAAILLRGFASRALWLRRVSAFRYRAWSSASPDATITWGDARPLQSGGEIERRRQGEHRRAVASDKAGRLSLRTTQQRIMRARLAYCGSGHHSG